METLEMKPGWYETKSSERWRLGLEIGCKLVGEVVAKNGSERQRSGLLGVASRMNLT